jgi:hypothetical protein
MLPWFLFSIHIQLVGLCVTQKNYKNLEQYAHRRHVGHKGLVQTKLIIKSVKEQGEVLYTF